MPLNFYAALFRLCPFPIIRGVLIGMLIRKLILVLILPSLLLSGCSFISDRVFPDRDGSELPPPASATEVAELSKESSSAKEASELSKNPPPQLGNSSFKPAPVTPGIETGTFVGQKVSQLRNELNQLQINIVRQNERLQKIREQVVQTSQTYHGTVAAIQTRLQVGTTPGNPVLIDQWNQAQIALDNMGEGINLLNSLANSVASDSAFAAFLLESTQATFGLSGAIDEDHRQLVILEDETNRTVVLIDRLLNELSEDVSRQTAYVGSERSNLTTLSASIKNGELLGPSLRSTIFTTLRKDSNTDNNSSRPLANSSIMNKQPLVVIRFDRPDVPFERALFAAMSRTLEQRPNAQFDLVAVSPSKGNPAELALNSSKSKDHAARVFRAITDMGMPANRVSLSSTTLDRAVTNEVHIYVR